MAQMKKPAPKKPAVKRPAVKPAPLGTPPAKPKTRMTPQDAAMKKILEKKYGKIYG